MRSHLCRVALAALGFELLTGKALQPWATLSSVRARAWARSAPIEARDPLSPGLETVFERALHDNAGLRFPSAAAFVEALSGALEARGQQRRKQLRVASTAETTGATAHRVW